MKTGSFYTRTAIGRTLLSSLALVVFAAFAIPQAGHAAGTAANAAIKNVVTVRYKDVAGTQDFTVVKNSVVTIALQKSALAVTGLLTDLERASGATANYTYYTLTSTANGADAYKVNIAFSSPTDVVGQTGDLYLFKYDVGTSALAQVGSSLGQINGTTITYAAPVDVSIGATSMIGWDGTDVLSVPGGALNGIAAGSIVMVGSKGPFRVTGTTSGAAATTTTAETYATITLTSYDSSDLTTVTVGDIGSTVGERVYLKVAVTASATAATVGTIVHTITTTDSAGTNVNTSGILTNTTSFLGTALTVTKLVANCGPAAYNGACAGASAATLTGAKPGDVLEYTVTVQNTGGGQANSVLVEDNVPVYTALVQYPTTFLTGGSVGAATNASTVVFAQGNDEIDTVQVQIAGNGTADVLYGQAAAVGPETNPTVAGSTLKFWLGATSAVGTGGNLTAAPANPTYTIKYRVEVKN